MKVTVEVETWELQHIHDLAVMVLNSKQNVGRTLRDKADAVKKIAEKMTPKRNHSPAGSPAQPEKQ